MNVRILGAHHFESGSDRYSCFVIDGKLAVDAGALTSTLSAGEQEALRGVLVTHAHFDHVRDIPSLAANLFSAGRHIDIYATERTKKTIQSNLLNGEVYPDFFSLPANAPTITWNRVAAGETREIEGYRVLALGTNHGEGALGYYITGKDGETLFYSGDTGPGLSSVWKKIAPASVMMEVTWPDRMQDFALRSGHLTPGLLRLEMEEFRCVRGYLPEITAIHMDRLNEDEIRRELDEVGEALGTEIVSAREGLEISLRKDNRAPGLRVATIF